MPLFCVETRIPVKQRCELSERVESSRRGIYPVQFVGEEQLKPRYYGQVVSGLDYDDLRPRVSQEAGVFHGGHYCRD